MSVSVVIPYGGSDPWRGRLFRWVHRRWERTLPEAELIVGRSDHDLFNRSAARNDGATRAHGDTLIFADADVVVHPLAVRAAVAAGRWGYPFDVYFTMREPWTTVAVDQEPETDFAGLTEAPDDADVVHRHPGDVAAECVSGCVIVPAAVWAESGGYDEQFELWGAEDNAFAIVLNRVAGAPARVSANALHLWHSTEGANFDHPGWPANQQRLLQYQKGHL